MQVVPPALMRVVSPAPSVNSCVHRRVRTASQLEPQSRRTAAQRRARLTAASSVAWAARWKRTLATERNKRIQAQATSCFKRRGSSCTAKLRGVMDAAAKLQQLHTTSLRYVEMGLQATAQKERLLEQAAAAAAVQQIRVCRGLARLAEREAQVLQREAAVARAEMALRPLSQLRAAAYPRGPLAHTWSTAPPPWTGTAQQQQALTSNAPSVAAGGGGAVPVSMQRVWSVPIAWPRCEAVLPAATHMRRWQQHTTSTWLPVRLPGAATVAGAPANPFARHAAPAVPMASQTIPCPFASAAVTGFGAGAAPGAEAAGWSTAPNASLATPLPIRPSAGTGPFLGSRAPSAPCPSHGFWSTPPKAPVAGQAVEGASAAHASRTIEDAQAVLGGLVRLPTVGSACSGATKCMSPA